MLTTLKNILEQLDIPIAYSHFNTATKLPYLVFYEVSSDNVFADNKVYQECISVEIELYTQYKDTTLESRLKTLLNDNEIPFEKIVETYISEEKMFESVYQVELYSQPEIASI